MPKLLRLVEKSDPILREVMPPVETFDDPKLTALIEDMRYSIMPAQLKKCRCDSHSAAGMAANQWGVRKRVFLYTPDGSGPKKPLTVMLNPSYKPFVRPTEKAPKMVSAYEGCFSIPLTTGLISRYDAIIATYDTPEGKKIEKILEGYEARVFQHETDHLNGKLYDGRLDNFDGPHCLERIIFKNRREMEAFYTEGKRPDQK